MNVVIQKVINVAICDDMVGIRYLACHFTREILKGYDVQMYPFGDGTGLVRLCQEKQPDLSLIILDLQMPAMGGVETYNQIRSQYPETPIMFFSAKLADPHFLMKMRIKFAHDPHVYFCPKNGSWDDFKKGLLALLLK